MEREYSKPDSEFRLHMCCMGFDGGVDRISRLPDEIIIFILSFLSMREAAATSILSPRWLDLWKHTPNLVFTDKSLNTLTRTPSSLWNVNDSPYIGWISSIMHSHKALFLKQFIINVFVTKSAHSTVTKWLEFVFSRQVEKLALIFQCADQNYQVSLTKLLRDSNICGEAPQPQILFKSLKSLFLCSLIASGDDIELFLRNCPLLERLSISFAHLTSDFEVCGANLMLNYFKIISITGNGSVKVSAPNLTWLAVDDDTPGQLLLKNNPKLVGMAFTYGSPSTNVVQHFSFAVSCCIAQLKILNLNLNRPAMFLVNGFPEMPNLKKLIVTYKEPIGQNLLPVTALIRASPRLQEFKLEFVSVVVRPFDEKVIVDVGRSMHHHLKTFHFRGFGGDVGDHIQLVMYILDTCIALREIIIAPYPDKGKEVIARDYAMTQLQGKLPRRVRLRIL